MDIALYNDVLYIICKCRKNDYSNFCGGMLLPEHNILCYLWKGTSCLAKHECFDQKPGRFN